VITVSLIVVIFMSLVHLVDGPRRPEVASSHEAELPASHHSIRDKRSDEFVGGFR
jgi:hypothetical protein